MIYLSLFWEFLKIGLFTFGGAYGAIPLIRQCVLAQGWMDDAMFANILAISESTPGPIMVNSATYIGATQGGILGAAVATLGVVLPSFIIILLIAALFTKLIQHRRVKAILKGVKPCIMGVILATGFGMFLEILLSIPKGFCFNLPAALLLGILIATCVLYQKIRKKSLSPILLITLSAILGILLF